MRAGRVLGADRMKGSLAPMPPMVGTHTQTSGCHRPRPVEQRRAHGHRSPLGHDGRHAVPAHQFA